MRTGSFTATGFELERLRDWRLIVGLIAFLQIIPVIPLWGAAILPPDLRTLEVSFVVSVMGVVLLGSIRLARGRPALVTVEWVDSRDPMGTVQVSYVGPRGKKRSGLIIQDIEPRPKDPLFRPGTSRYTPAVPVEGTHSSLILNFRNMTKFSLGLGFHSVEEMNIVYEQLK